MTEGWMAFVWALLPTVAVSGIFWFILRNIMNADRNERRALAEIEAEERRARGMAPQPDSSA